MTSWPGGCPPDRNLSPPCIGQSQKFAPRRFQLAEIGVLSVRSCRALVTSSLPTVDCLSRLPQVQVALAARLYALGRLTVARVTENVKMEVWNTKVTETLADEYRTVETATSQAEMEKKPPLLQTESLENSRESIQAGSTSKDELERLYESRKTTDGAKNCREFFTSRPKGLLTLAVCIGVIVVVTAATVVAVILNPHSAPRFHNEENTTTFPVYSTTSYTYLPVTSSTHLIVTSTTSSTVTIDWWSEWILYIRKYFQHDKDALAAMGLEERYSDNEVVMTLLEGRFFWPFVCRYWKERAGLPNSLAGAVTHCILHGVSSDEYMKTHGLATYGEVFQSILYALEALYMSNTTQAHKDNDHTHLSLSGLTLSGDDVEALASLFLYLRGLFSLQLTGCGLSAEAAMSMAGQIHQLNALNSFYLGKNMIGDGGMEAIAEMFPHLKELRTLDIRENSITSVGGKTMVEKLVELQELRNINLAGNELALSLSSLAKAFDNMTRLESVRLCPITCRADSFREAALQVRDAVHTLKGKVFSYFGMQRHFLYDGGKHAAGSSRLDTAWQRSRLEQKLTSGVYIKNKRVKMALKIRLLEEQSTIGS
ncbi:hypothetical protein Bbelb_239880 [Branchiostoma belcheri]|nr:hypothetical protein Bbelb_239880 [Branchiostoma belcheri]